MFRLVSLTSVMVGQLVWAQTDKFGFTYDNTGNLTALKNVTYDAQNCGDIGTTCGAGVQCCSAAALSAVTRRVAARRSMSAVARWPARGSSAAVSTTAAGG
jgi:hypothetical protein